MAIYPHYSYMTVEEYLELDRNSPDVRYEYIDGQVTMLAGGTANHSVISGNVHRILHNLLRGSPCQVYNSDLRIDLSEERYVYPDVSVSCDPRDRGEVTVMHYPILVVEVLSSSTESLDRGDKALSYREHPTIQEYLLVSTKRPLIEIFRRGKGDLWLLSTLHLNDEVHLASLGVNFPVKEVYEDIVFPEGRFNS